MDGRTISITVAALLAAVTGTPAQAPAPAAAEAPHPAALAAPPPRQPTPLRLSASDMECLALNVYWEARGQPERGQEAVAHVTLNRRIAEGFPGTVCGVVHQRANGTCQFGWVCDHRSHRPTDEEAWRTALEVSARAAAGEPDPTGGALYFHHVKERPQYARGRYRSRVVIGDHVFFSLRRDDDQQLAEVPEGR